MQKNKYLNLEGVLISFIDNFVKALLKENSFCKANKFLTLGKPLDS